MIWFIVALLIFAVLGGMIDFACNGWAITKEFFTDSYWGIITIVVGALSLAMFYASSKTYRDVKINETFLPNPRKIRKRKLTMSEHQEFDLSKMTMETLVRQMAYQLTKPAPIFFKGWGNRRLELDVERVQILGKYVESIRTTGSYLMELHADAALSYEKIEKLIHIKRNELKIQLRKSILDYDFLKQEHVERIRAIKLENDEREARVRLINAQASKLEAEAGSVTTKSDSDALKDAARTDLLFEGKKHFKSLSPVLKTYVITQIDNEHAKIPENDLEMQEALKDVVKRKQQAEAKKLEAEANEVEAQSNFNVQEIKKQK